MKKGYTITELLIVMVVIGLLMAIAIPALSTLMRAGRQDSARWALSAANAVSKSYANSHPPFGPGTYQGTALIITPSSEIRIVQHYENAKDKSDRYLYQTPHTEGYRDIPKENYVHLSEGVGMVGILRSPRKGFDGGDLWLIAPPFAVRFSPQGHMVVGNHLGNNAVIYDGNYDGKHDVSSIRPEGYNPDDYDPEVKGKETFDPTIQKYKMGFEVMESVIGVIAYDKHTLRKQGLKLTTGPRVWNPDTMSYDPPFIPDNTKEWLVNNGSTYFFNRYTGAIIRN